MSDESTSKPTKTYLDEESSREEFMGAMGQLSMIAAVLMERSPDKKIYITDEEWNACVEKHKQSTQGVRIIREKDGMTLQFWD